MPPPYNREASMTGPAIWGGIVGAQHMPERRAICAQTRLRCPPPDSAGVYFVVGWSSPVARQPHKLKVAGSNPAPATNNGSCMPSRPPSLRPPAKRTAWATPSKAAVVRIRGRRGQAIRAGHLAREPLCRECAKEGLITQATIVDHIIALAEGGPDTLDNRQSLCGPHHDAKTKGEAARARKRGR